VNVRLWFAVLALLGGCAIPTPSPRTSEDAACIQQVFNRGADWQEIGGPRAFVLAFPYVANADYPAKVFVRFEEGIKRPLSIEARLPDEGLREEGEVQNAIEREDWAPDGGPPAGLTGSIHMAIVRFPRSGCWRLTLLAGSDVVGMARIEVRASQ
jgi:hypothetical protein